MKTVPNAVRAYLMATTAFTTVCTGGVVRSPANKDQPYPFCEMKRVGGESHDIAHGVCDINIMFWCWGSTITEADNLYNALVEALQALHNVTYLSVKLHGAVEVIAGQDFTDLDTQKPYVLCTWSVNAR